MDATASIAVVDVFGKNVKFVVKGKNVYFVVHSVAASHLPCCTQIALEENTDIFEGSSYYN